MQKGLKKQLTDHDVNRICNSVTSAVKLRREQGVTSETKQQLSKDIMNCVHHVFNDHTHCARDFCKSDEGTAPKPLNPTLLTKIKVNNDSYRMLQWISASPKYCWLSGYMITLMRFIFRFRCLLITSSIDTMRAMVSVWVSLGGCSHCFKAFIEEESITRRKMLRFCVFSHINDIFQILW